MLLFWLNLDTTQANPNPLPSFYWETQNTVIGTTWDNGNTKWDVDGNVIQTFWDEEDPTYSEAANNSVIWFTQ